jgi:hypothetical protein
MELLGTLEDIPAIVRARGVDRVVVNLADARGKLSMDKLLEMRLDGVRFDHLASVYEQYTGRIAVEHLRPSWLVFSTVSPSRASARVKRATDVSGSLLAVVVRCRSWPRWPCCGSRPGSRPLPAASRRPARTRVPAAQVPVDAAGRRSRDRRGVGRRGRRPRHAARPACCARRISTSCRSCGTSSRRHEPGRAAAGAARVRQGPPRSIPFYG